MDTSSADAATTVAVQRILEATERHPCVIVTTTEGVLPLSGFADSLADKERATQMVNPICGVKSVDNQIHVP